jgi:hypothetical protein
MRVVKVMPDGTSISDVLRERYPDPVSLTGDAFHKAGFDVVAFEYFQAHREYMAEKVPHIKLVDTPATTDLMLFVETAEHMTDAELDALFGEIRPSYILFSSTSERTDSDVQWGHINVKEQDEWIDYFDALGYRLLCDLPKPTPWSKLFALKDGGREVYNPPKVNSRRGRECHYKGDEAYHAGDLDKAKELWAEGAAWGNEQCKKNLEWISNA